MAGRRFPIQGGSTVSWAAAERAYESYVMCYGRDQSLERLAERGGFGLCEFADLYNGGNGRGRLLSEGQITLILACADVRDAVAALADEEVAAVRLVGGEG